MHNTQILYGLSPAFFFNFIFISGLLSQVPYTPVTFAIPLKLLVFSHLCICMGLSLCSECFLLPCIHLENYSLCFKTHLKRHHFCEHIHKLPIQVCVQISLPWISSAQHIKHMLLQILTKGTHAGLPPSDHEACLQGLFPIHLCA